MREPVTKELQGAVYQVRPLPTGKALAVGRRIMPAALRAMDGFAGSHPMDALAGAIESLSDADIAFVAGELAASTLTGPDEAHLMPLKDHYDLQFSGRLDAWLAWIRLALEVNYASFLTGVVGMVPGKASG